MSIADFSGRKGPDACPGALQVHQAADGPLARIRLPGGVITAAQLRVLAPLGALELTSRANLQVRGLSDAADLAERVAAAGLLPSITHERVRNIVASPFGSHALVRELDLALCARPALAGLPGRFLFAIGEVGLNADVALVEGRLLLAGRELDGVAASVGGMLDAAEAFLQVRDREWRVAELDPSRVADRLGATLGPPFRADPPPRRPGRYGDAVQALVPLGRLTAAPALAELADEVRLTPWRTVVVPHTPGVLGRLEAAGLITDPDSPWVGVTACTGRPGCAKALADVRADAAAWVREHPAHQPVHWAGCDRLCGLPPGQVRKLVATGEGYEER